MRTVLDLLMMLDLTPEEQEIVGFVQFPDGRQRWVDAAHRWEMEFSDDQYQLLEDIVRSRTSWPNGHAGPALDLLERMGLE